jgi:hypothetical protein
VEGFNEEATVVEVLTVAGFTVNELLVPVLPALPPKPAAVIVKLPVFVMITLKVLRTPFVNAVVWTGAPLRPVGVDVSITVPPLPVPLKLVTVLLLASWAVMVMLKAVPAICGLAIVAKLK